MLELEPPLPPTVCDVEASSHRQSPSGHQKTRMRNSLPAVFLLYVRQLELILGAGVFTDAFQLENGDPDVFWNATRLVELADHIPITQSMCQYRGNIFLLRPEAETSVRESTTVQGEGVMLASQSLSSQRSGFVVSAPISKQLRDYCAPRWFRT